MTTEINLSAIEQIRNEAKKLKREKLYSVEEIMDKKLILNTKFEPSRFTLYRLIHRNNIPSVRVGAHGNPRYFIKGEHLKKYIEENYDTKNII